MQRCTNLPDMTLFTKVTPRDIDNIFWDFESFFSRSIRIAENSCYDHGINEFPNHNYIKYITNHNVFEKYYSQIIDDLCIQVLKQVTTYNKKKLILYVEIQNRHIKTFLPDNRKRELFKDYLVLNIACGDDSILNSCYLLNHYQKSMVRLAFDKYVAGYFKLCNEITKLFMKVHEKNILPNFDLPQPTTAPSFDRSQSTVAANFDLPQPTTRASFSPSKYTSVNKNNQSGPLILARYDPKDPSGPVKALFFYYLFQAKEISLPIKSDFESLMKKYHFHGCPRNVYNYFSPLNNGLSNILNKTNLKKVILLLDGHRAASHLADNDLFQILSETTTKILFLPVFYYGTEMIELLECSIA